VHDYEAACRALEAAGGTDELLLRRVTELAQTMDRLGGWELETEARAILGRLGIRDTSARMGTLSGGERKRVGLARALLLHPDLLILDEPTNHLDADTIAWLEEWLSRYTGALLFVTHDRYFLDRITNRVLEIEGQRVNRFVGNYTRYLEMREEREARRESEARTRDNLVRRELAWLRRGAKARTTKQKARVGRAEALMAEEIAGPGRAIEIGAASTRLGRKVLELEGVSVSFGERAIVRDFTFRLLPGDRVGVIGPNGAGKTTLLELLAGRLTPDSGEVVRGDTVALGYYDQESRGLDDAVRVIDSVREIAEQVRTADGSFITAGQLLERFLFTPDAQYTQVGRLSGGERRRLYLLRILMAAPNVLLLDEPTNDFDIETLVALESYLDAFGGSLVVVSHDRYFLDRTVDQLLVFEGDGRVRPFPGSYSAFAEARAEEARARETREREARTAAPRGRSTPASEGDGARKLTWKETREMETLEAEIASGEARREEIAAALAEAGSDFAVAGPLYEELQALDARLTVAMERWGALAERA
jgi:ABC transport system ATP-binding/permease protein